jgi:hypothetical protein
VPILVQCFLFQMNLTCLSWWGCSAPTCSRDQPQHAHVERSRENDRDQGHSTPFMGDLSARKLSCFWLGKDFFFTFHCVCVFFLFLFLFFNFLIDLNVNDMQYFMFQNWRYAFTQCDGSLQNKRSKWAGGQPWWKKSNPKAQSFDETS